MNPNNDHEARWLAVSTARMAERASRAYDHLKNIVPDNDKDAADLNNARLNLASVKEAAEIMRDLYQPLLDANPGELGLPAPEQVQGPGFVSWLRKNFG
jgi:hypothetical protein